MPTTASVTSIKRETLNLRIRADDRGLIDRAAAALGKNRTEFVLDAARQAAQDALLDRASFELDDATYAAFVARLDAPPVDNPLLAKTMKTPAPWDRT